MKDSHVVACGEDGISVFGWTRSLYVYMYMRICIFACVYVYMYMCCVFVYMNMCCVYMYMCICTCICVCTYSMLLHAARMVSLCLVCV
jgi:hypothetical protein